jgi:hypothetical protein
MVRMPFVQKLRLVVDLNIFNQRAESIMTIDQLLKLAQDHYAGARVTANPTFKRMLVEIGNTYLHEAEKLKRAYALNTLAVETIIEPQVI